MLLAGTFALSGVTSVMAADVNLDANESVALDKLEVTTDIPIEETTVSQAFDAGEEINQLGRVSYSKGVKIDGTDYRLYPEFEDADHAVSELEKAAKNGMDYLRTNYDLEALSNNNYEEYQACVCEALGEENVYTNEALEDELYLIDGFLDIYENGDDNREILEAVASVDGNFAGTTVAETAEATSELQLALPYNTGADKAIETAAEEIAADVEQEYDVTFVKPGEAVQEELSSLNQPGEVCQLGTLAASNRNPQTELLTYSGNSAFKPKKGIAYAKKYAPTKKGNPKYKYFDGADCTNFVSQIKRAGGVKDHVEWSSGVNPFIRKDSSWYYNNGSYGAIWVNANKFAKFFGVKYKTKNFATFSTKVKKGSFITEDKKGDGNWDHMAFVTVTTTTKKKYKNITYNDFKVSQHTNDYHAYVSEKVNKWETLTKNKGIVFAIVN